MTREFEQAQRLTQGQKDQLVGYFNDLYPEDDPEDWTAKLDRHYGYYRMVILEDGAIIDSAAIVRCPECGALRELGPGQDAECWNCEFAE